MSAPDFEAEVREQCAALAEEMIRVANPILDTLVLADFAINPEAMLVTWLAGREARRASIEHHQIDDERFGVRVRCDVLANILIAKNRAYGDSALSPLRVFSKASLEEQILVRLDDKLSRLARGSAAGEDVELDLMGYLVLLRIARKRAAT